MFFLLSDAAADAAAAVEEERRLRAGTRSVLRPLLAARIMI